MKQQSKGSLVRPQKPKPCKRCKGTGIELGTGGTLMGFGMMPSIQVKPSPCRRCHGRKMN